MKLLGSLTSPFVRKIRITLAEKGIACEMVVEDVWSADSTISTRNPLSKVPTLELDDGTVLYDSKMISEAIEMLNPLPSLFPTDVMHRIAVRKLEALGDGVMEAAVAFFLENRFHDETKRSDTWLERQTLKILRGCDAMEALLAESTSGFLHNGFSIADICAGCALFYVDLRMSDVNWREGRPKLAAYAAQLAQRQSFFDTQPPK
jgi:glutathione S-transferase